MTKLVTKLYHLHDEASQEWSAVFRAPGIDADEVTATVSRAERSPSRIYSALLAAGANLPDNKSAMDAISAAMVSDAPIVHRAARTGWREDYQRFVTPLNVSGAGASDHTVIPPKDAASSAGAVLRESGTLEGWQAMVRIAERSTPMTVNLCAVFAALLLALLHRPSFAIMWGGPSRCGKSTIQLVAASLLGFGREEDLPSLNATEAGLLNMCLAFNDLALFLNEVGTARGGKKDMHNVLSERTYALMSGRDVMRHPCWSGSMSSVPVTFRTIPILSSELSPDEWAARGGVSRDPGETLRLIGVPALFGGHPTVFDMPPNDALGDETEWAHEQFSRLRKEIPQQTGVAFRKYTDMITQYRSTITNIAEILLKRFENHMRRQATSAVAKDVISKFGVLYAGGFIAIRYGVLPLSYSVMSAAIKRACLAALDAIPDPQANLKEDLQNVVELIESGGVVDAASMSKKDKALMRSADGYKETYETGLLYVLRSEVLAARIATPPRYRALLEWLDDEGLLKTQKTRSVGRSTEWAQSQRRWPDGTRLRSVCIYVPNGLSDLRLD